MYQQSDQTTQQVIAYVINLDSRPDRWKSALAQEKTLGLKIVRVKACESKDIDVKKDPYVPTGVSATWKSHQLAMRLFLDSGNPFCLIMEDDFLLTRDISGLLSTVFEIEDLDIMQLGILDPTNYDKLLRIMANMRDLFWKILARVGFRLSKFLQSKILIQEQLGVPFKFVTSDIRAGGHAYIASRNFALAMQELNNPVFLSTDGVFMAIGSTRAFRAYRTRHIWISQSGSPTSVEARFNLRR
jgi:GR25 family glycosyltransferase involved in LPS biosynthesis